MRNLLRSTSLIVLFTVFGLARAQSVESITFKDVPLGVEGNTAAVKALCKLPAGYSTSQGWCALTGPPGKNKAYRMPQVRYGNVVSDITIHITDAGAVVDVRVPVPSQHIERMVELLTGKFGTPRTEVRQLRNNLGGPPVENPTWFWQDARGARAMVWLYDPLETRGVGVVHLQSPGYASLSDAIPRILDKAERESL